MLFHGNPAEIELVAFDPNDPHQAWYVSAYGGLEMPRRPATNLPGSESKVPDSLTSHHCVGLSANATATVVRTSTGAPSRIAGL